MRHQQKLLGTLWQGAASARLGLQLTSFHLATQPPVGHATSLQDSEKAIARLSASMTDTAGRPATEASKLLSARSTTMPENASLEKV
jgi:hypothetical protein